MINGEGPINTIRINIRVGKTEHSTDGSSCFTDYYDRTIDLLEDELSLDLDLRKYVGRLVFQELYDIKQAIEKKY